MAKVERMGQVARYYLRWWALYMAGVAAFFAADILLCLVFGSSWFGALYLGMANYLFLLLHGIVMMQLMQLAGLLLGCGVTRRALTGGWLLTVGVSSVLTTLLGKAMTWLGRALVPQEGNPFTSAIADMPWWLLLLLALAGGALMGNFAVLAAKGAWAVFGGILMLLLTMFLIMALPALCALLSNAEKALMAAALLALAAAALIPCVHHLRRLAL